MPANSGAISGTVAHKHELSGATGGYLAEGLTGITGGLVNEVLTNDGTDVPVWAAPSSSAVWTADGQDSGDKAALNVGSMTGRDITHIFYQVEPSTISTNEFPRMRVNSQILNYDQLNQSQYVNSTPAAITWNQTATGFFLDEEAGHTSELQYIGDILLYKGISTMEATGMFMTLRGLSYRNDQPHMSNIVYGGGYQPDTSAITDISFTMSSGNISGKIQVNSMDYQ